MILLCHGAFDYKSDPESGIEILAGKLCAQGHEVVTIDKDEKIQGMPEYVLGYSNGADNVITQATWKVKVMVFIDPVWKSLWKQTWRDPFNIGENVLVAWSFLRKETGFPRNSLPSKGVIERYSLGHGEMQFSESIHRQVVQLFSGDSNGLVFNPSGT